MELSVLHHKENVGLDPDKLMGLYVKLGENAAEDMIERAMETLARRLAEMERQFSTQDIAALCKSCNVIRKLSQDVGLTSVAQVSRDVVNCALRSDQVALAATWARLSRIGDQSLSEVWDLRGQSV